MPRDPRGWYRRWGKRTLDVAFSTVALLVTAPLLVAVAGAVWATVGWPILFRQVRPGLNGVPFELVKFRTMRDPRPGELWYRTDQARLTPIGRVLRKLSLDELPTLWNVLRGDMSLVGPRPLLVEYLGRYTPRQARRHEVRPGVSGWAQVNGRQVISFSRRLEMDVWYVDHWGLALDLRILWLTGWRLLSPAEVVPGQDVDDVDDLSLSPDRGTTAGPREPR